MKMKNEEKVYWEAFVGRMHAFGLGQSVVRGLNLTGAWGDDYRALNEWLRERMPVLADDEAACEYIKKVREDAINRKAEWTYPTPEWRHLQE